MTDHIETTLPALIFTVTAPVLSAAGRLVVDNDGTIGWWGVTSGGETDAVRAFSSFARSEGRAWRPTRPSLRV